MNGLELADATVPCSAVKCGEAFRERGNKVAEGACKAPTGDGVG